MGEGGGIALDVGEDGAAFVVALLFTAVGAGIFAVWTLYFNLVRLLLFFWRKNMVTGQVIEVYHCRDSTSLLPWKELLVVYTPVGVSYSLQCKLRVNEDQDIHVCDQINLAFNKIGPLHYSTRHPFDQPAGNRKAISGALCFLWCCCFVVAGLILAISGEYMRSYWIPIVAMTSASIVVIAFVIKMADRKVRSPQGLQQREMETEESAEDVEIELKEEPVEPPLSDSTDSIPQPSWDPDDDTSFAAQFPDDDEEEMSYRGAKSSFGAGSEFNDGDVDKEMSMDAEGMELGLLDDDELALPVMEMETMEELDD